MKLHPQCQDHALNHFEQVLLFPLSAPPAALRGMLREHSAPVLASLFLAPILAQLAQVGDNPVMWLRVCLTLKPN